MPYLIQRACFESKIPRGSKLSVDDVLDLDYMGSAEFECGALPKSLARIRERHSSGDKVVCHTTDVRVTHGPFKGNFVQILTNSSIVEFGASFITALAFKHATFRFKEWIKFEYHFEQPSEFDREWAERRRVNETVWWALEDDFFFTVDAGKSNLLLKAITQESSVKDTDLRMFDRVRYVDSKGQVQYAKVCGIGEQIKVKHSNGYRAKISIHQIEEVLGDKE